jgi:hypothetical protein
VEEKMLVDCRCPVCDTIYEDKILFNDEIFLCDVCKVACERQVSLDATFRLKYDNKKDKVSWGAEGYRPSQYWNEQNKLAKKNIFVQGGKKEG